MQKIMMLMAILFLAGCAKLHKPQPVSFIQATPTVEKPKVIQVPLNKEEYRLKFGQEPGLEKAFNEYMKTGKAPNILTDGFIKFAYLESQQPIIHAMPSQITIISLAKGERYSNITSGDPNGWEYSVALSGNPSLSQQHILVKPLFSQISTNLVVTTDQRIYNLRLVSSPVEKITRHVSFWYPNEMVAQYNHASFKQMENQPIAHMPDVNLSQLNFRYRILSKGFFAPSWKPVRVFDDGVHTYIQFPHQMVHRDMPVLFVLNGRQKALVNYSSKPPYFVVDKIFKKAVLLLGVGLNQSQVILVNDRY